MSPLTLHNGLLLGHSVPGTITIVDDRISAITSVLQAAAPRRGDIAIDVTDLVVAPGCIDLQINGGFGIDLMSQPERMWELGQRLVSHGVTAFLPTIVSSSKSTIQRALEALDDRPYDYRGAEPLGLHLEGPMLQPERRGAHRAEALQHASLDVIEGWTRDNGVTLVTLAPELPGALDVIAELRRRDVAVSAGHTNATSDEMQAAKQAGVSMVTHLYNAMRPLHHREPGVAGFTLSDGDIVAGLIVDGIHVDPVMVRATCKAKQVPGICLVTDAVAPMGCSEGAYKFSGFEVTVDDNGVRLVDGTLAGSNLTMNQAIKNLMRWTGCSIYEAIAVSSTTPAHVLGDETRGALHLGARGDIVVYDQDASVLATVVGGVIVYADARLADRITDNPQVKTR